jgi:hypothetical protein
MQVVLLSSESKSGRSAKWNVSGAMSGPMHFIKVAELLTLVMTWLNYLKMV